VSLAELEAHIVRVLPSEPEPEPVASAVPAEAVEPAEAAHGAQDVIDVDGRYQQWLDAVGHEAVVIRPDFYVFGGVASAADLPALLDELFGQLGLVGSAAS
jgi:hypothetical protein